MSFANEPLRKAAGNASLRAGQRVRNLRTGKTGVVIAAGACEGYKHGGVEGAVIGGLGGAALDPTFQMGMARGMYAAPNYLAPLSIGAGTQLVPLSALSKKTSSQ